MPLVTSSRDSNLTSLDKINTSGLVKGSPQDKLPESIAMLQVSEPTVKSIVVDQRYTPADDIITHVEGSSWIVDAYYSQILNRDSELSGQQINVSAAWQQYRKINNLELKVTSALSTSQQDKSKALEVGGTALVMSGVIPNEGDMFVVYLGEGNPKCFIITATIQKSIFNNTVYEVTYELDNDYIAKLKDLENKVVEEFFYHQDMITYGSNPLLLSSQNNSYIDLQKNYNDLLSYYFTKFFSREFSTMIVPRKGQIIYDSFLTDFVLKMFGTDEHPNIQKIKKPNVDDSPSLTSDSVLTAIMKREPRVLGHCFKRCGTIGTGYFTFDPTLMSIKYSGIQKVVFPVDANQTIDELMRYGYALIGDDYVDLEIGVLNTYTGAYIDPDALKDKPDYLIRGAHSLRENNHYIFSEHFYTKSNKQSPFEALVWRYITNSKIENAVVLTLCPLIKSYGLVEQFYLIPILLVLMRSCMRSGGSMSNDSAYRFINSNNGKSEDEMIKLNEGKVIKDDSEFIFRDPIDTFMNIYRGKQ